AGRGAGPADGAAMAAADARGAGWGLLPLAGLPAPALAGSSPPGSLGRRRPDRPEQPRPHLHLPPPPAPRAGLEGHREPQRRAPVLAAGRAAAGHRATGAASRGAGRVGRSDPGPAARRLLGAPRSRDERLSPGRRRERPPPTGRVGPGPSSGPGRSAWT